MYLLIEGINVIARIDLKKWKFHIFKFKKSNFNQAAIGGRGAHNDLNQNCAHYFEFFRTVVVSLRKIEEIKNALTLCNKVIVNWPKWCKKIILISLFCLQKISSKAV